MPWIALKMLTGNRSKYLAIVLGVAFATWLMAHQTTIFCGVMRRTTSQIRDVRDASIWVMDPGVQYIDETRPLSSTDLHRVRGVPGVAWAVPYYRGRVRVLVPDGTYRYVVLNGIDNATLIGGPTEMVRGKLGDLRQPDAFIVDDAGYQYLWPGAPFELGKEVSINDRRAVLVGICKASPPFDTVPVLYTRYATAEQLGAQERRMLSYVLVQPAEGVSPQELCACIQQDTGLQALTSDEFFWKTIGYYFQHTGIPINFLITVAIGFIVGVGFAGQTFYLFTLENLKYFGALKAVGFSDRSLVAMVLLQALVVGAIGFGLGIGLTTLVIDFFVVSLTHLAGFYLLWEVMAGTALAIVVIMVSSSLISIRRVLVLEPAMVFRK